MFYIRACEHLTRFSKRNLVFYFRVSMHIDSRDETLSQTFCFIIGYPRNLQSEPSELIRAVRTAKPFLCCLSIRIYCYNGLFSICLFVNWFYMLFYILLCIIFFSAYVTCKFFLFPRNHWYFNWILNNTFDRIKTRWFTNDFGRKFIKLPRPFLIGWPDEVTTCVRISDVWILFWFEDVGPIIFNLSGVVE